MASHNRTRPEAFSPATFDETAWLNDQQQRGRRLHQWVDDWLKGCALPDPIASRVRQRVLPWSSGCVEGPATFTLCAAESLELPESSHRILGIASAFYWAAADVADDVDDGEASPDSTPTANDACSLLFLAMRALQEAGPRFAAMGVELGLRMGAGQARDLDATGRPTSYDPLQIARDKAGAEFALFLGLAARAGDLPEQPLMGLGEALGTALQVFSDVADLYMADQSLDLISAKHTRILTAFAHRHATRAEQLLAADRTWPDLQAGLRFEMKEAAHEALSNLEGPIEAAWNEAAPILGDPAPLRQLVDWILGLLHVTRQALAEVEEPAPVVLPDLASTMERGLAYLQGGPFAERHTWGLFDKPVVEGTLFPTIFVMAARREAGAEWEQGLEYLLQLRDSDGWRYYAHERAIPSDADDAGLILGYFGDALPTDVRTATVEQLLGAMGEDGIHTWLVPAEGAIEWEGDDCTATLANATWGLLRNGAGQQIPPGVWQRLLRHVAGDEYASPFYTCEATRFFVHRCLASGQAGGWVGRAEGEMARQRLLDAYRTRRRWGGSTSDSVMATAFDLLAVMTWGETPEGDPAVYFGARQNIDGSWDGEPLFVTPWIEYRPKRWGHPALTTALVIETLAGWQRAVAR